MAAKCKRCGVGISFYKRFLVNPDKEIYLPCSSCGNELIEKNKYFNHVILTGLVLASSFFLIKLFPFDTLINSIIGFILVALYYLIFLPLKK